MRLYKSTDVDHSVSYLYQVDFPSVHLFTMTVTLVANTALSLLPKLSWILIFLRGEKHGASDIVTGKKSIRGCVYDPMYCSPPGSSVHGISHARILEWVAIFSSRGSSRPGD